MELDVRLFGWEDSLLGGSCELRLSVCFSFESANCVCVENLLVFCMILGYYTRLHHSGAETGISIK